MANSWTRLRHLVMVPGHAVFVAPNFQFPADDSSWFLLPFQRGEPPLYLDHIRAGVDAASRDAQSLLVFAGGQSRLNAGPRSEAHGYWALANHFGWWGHPDVAWRAATEEFSRDSMENLLFGICRFREMTGKWPHKITVAGWAFKEARFRQHAAALRWPHRRFHYIGVNEPVELSGAFQGETRARQLFDADPYGISGELLKKREERNPFRRTPPYAESCGEIVRLLRWKRRALFSGRLPWG